MCFSANASFAASGLLTVIGCVMLNRTHSFNWRFIGCTPLFFALQQAAEGIIWLTITNHSDHTLVTVCTLVYSCFAYVFWPVWVPYSLLLLEQSHQRRKLLLYCTILASAFSLFNLHMLMAYGSAVLIENNHLRYVTIYPLSASIMAAIPYLTALYVALVTVPFFISSIALMPLMGIAIAASFLATYIWYTLYLTSVWCFFAALISGLLLVSAMYNNKKQTV